ncbi:ABC transporter ATP-binding protein [Epibacterium sp. Ofav1-8]|uniref:ABC transporter ATP-binding protein n=1 Tax=Epibacterium sp. Ofav1-8 TaxID=2917735 RepID=UPI001EF4EB8C|nr:ABC transporter ATP-binding protein [Epibacterium sp. Ofav1-8]MCG7625162.1 ABC transporter ATP-binding protein [Epibacterium sp. Ofav1-8]
MPDLKIENLSVGYGKHPVLSDLSMGLDAGEAVALLGANGAGKTTLLKAAQGILPLFGGRVIFDGEDITALSSDRRVARGMVLVPENRELFPTLDVRTNLELGSYLKPMGRHTRLDWVYSLFPILAERSRQQVKTLSGGEQQMVAIGRALMSSPRLLMLDEPSIGLAPKIIREIFDVIGKLRDEGMTILLVEQNARLALGASQRGYVMEIGHLVVEGTARQLESDERLKKAYLGMNTKTADENSP